MAQQEGFLIILPVTVAKFDLSAGVIDGLDPEATLFYVVVAARVAKAILDLRQVVRASVFFVGIIPPGICYFPIYYRRKRRFLPKFSSIL